MRILKESQYNQGVGKYKLLSSTSGVGSIITSKFGYYVLISDINKWTYINIANSLINEIREEVNADAIRVYEVSKSRLSRRGLEVIDDFRFIEFIRPEKNLENLVCLIGIPHMALNESFNTPNWENHPIKKALERANLPLGEAHNYMINSTHFPKWFKNRGGELKKINEWRQIWLNECQQHNGVLRPEHFSPPRDGNAFIRQTQVRDINGIGTPIREYKTLEQTNLILICPNGHLSDIPWANYLRWRTEKDLRQRPDNDNGENLMLNVDPCCNNPNLKWTESKTKSDGYGSIFIECNSCHLGSGLEGNPKVNLEGINSLAPYCIGQKPWELDFNHPLNIPCEPCLKKNEINQKEKMQVALVTANNIYYANGFSSLFIPMHLVQQIPREIYEALLIIQQRYNVRNNNTPITRADYWNRRLENGLEDFLFDNNLNAGDDFENFKNQLQNAFLDAPQEDGFDRHEEYRWQEYRCFSTYSSLPDFIENRGLRFKDINLPIELSTLLKKIQQVEELKVTSVQLDFTRVKPKERIVVEGEVQESANGQNIFSIPSNDLFILPANEMLGEGLFFEFSNENIDSWIVENSDALNNRFGRYFGAVPDFNDQGFSSKMRIYNNKYKHFLIHSFSHMMLRELEFSCGYPTASLKERLYISTNPAKRMSGVLIYTAEGSEGSMGGLVSQGEPEKILEIIKRGLERSINCSSDPLCWESDGQGIFDLNLAACFSCSLVAETACEEMNLGLDRRVLVDEKFGYFSELLT